MDYIFTIVNEVTIYLPRFIFIMIVLICFSLFIRIVLQLIGQVWVTTTAHTATLVMLPIITYIITKVISGNIALSLGMVGALSIVRFRNPVRSPLELTVYFCAITMGIAAGVSLKWLIFLGIAIVLALLILISINVFFKKYLKKIFLTTSFSEGNSLSALEIQSSKEIDWLNKNSFLTLKKKTDNSFFYTLAAYSFEDLKKIEKEISKDSSIINYQLNK